MALNWELRTSHTTKPRAGVRGFVVFIRLTTAV